MTDPSDGRDATRVSFPKAPARGLLHDVPAPQLAAHHIAGAPPDHPLAAPAIAPTAVAAAQESRPAGWSTGFALLTSGGGLHLVLETREDNNPAHGPLRLADRHSHIVHATIPTGDLSANARTWRDRPVEIVTDRATRCRASVRSFDFRVDLIPDYYEERRWEGISDDPTEQLQPLREDQRAEAIWDAASTRMITARLRLADPNACKGEPLYARDLESPAARIAQPMTSVPRRTRVLQAFRSLPAYRAAQAEYAKRRRDDLAIGTSATTLWENDDRAPSLQAFAFNHHDDVLVSVSVPWAGCRAWDAALWAVFRIQATGHRSPVLVDLSTNIAPFEVRLVLQSDARHLDYVVDEGLRSGMAVVRNGQRLTAWSTEIHGCRC